MINLGIWLPKYEEKYYTVVVFEGEIEIRQYRWRDEYIDKQLYDKKLVFKNEKDAEKVKRKIGVLLELMSYADVKEILDLRC